MVVCAGLCVDNTFVGLGELAAWVEWNVTCWVGFWLTVDDVMRERFLILGLQSFGSLKVQTGFDFGVVVWVVLVWLCPRTRL